MNNIDSKRPLNLRINASLLERLRAVSIDSAAPYSPSINKVVERGIELAVKELEKK